jgi:predicted metal-dependent phosphoesterase TrpH
MCSLYDLHTHSTVSDGSLTPTALVRQAAAAGVRHLALTDHDSISGLSEAARAAAKAGINLINGVEISVTWNKQTVHIVGLGVSQDHAGLQRGLKRICDHREWRAGEIGRRLGKEGIPDALEGALRYAGGQLVSRTHFAYFLVETGRAKDVRQVFKRFLVANKPGHVRGEWASLEEALGWIKGAGGQAVVAHPARYNLTRSKLRRLFSEFKELGGEAIEVVSGSHNTDEYHQMAYMARDMGFLASAGSDYHGPDNYRIELGKLPRLPAGCEPIWSNWPDRFAA